MLSNPLGKSDARYQTRDVLEWRNNGAAVIANFFTSAEVAPVRADFDLLYGDCAPTSASPRVRDDDDTIGEFNAEQFQHNDDLPMDCSPALNMLALHPALIDLARATLDTPDVHMYQAHTWAKFTGETDYDQIFHCDFYNHTLTVPADDAGLKTINFMIYLTDVTDGHGAIHFVPQPVSDRIAGRDRLPIKDPSVQKQLRAEERSGAAPAGSVFAYGIDAYHRGTNLTIPNGRRYTLTVSFKAAGNDMIGWSAWPRTFQQPWHHIFNNANPDQLGCIGVPLPGDPFWTERTLARAQERWPDMDLGPYRSAQTTNEDSIG